jgi:hypothetical protein
MQRPCYSAAPCVQIVYTMFEPSYTYLLTTFCCICLSQRADLQSSQVPLCRTRNVEHVTCLECTRTQRASPWVQLNALETLLLLDHTNVLHCWVPQSCLNGDVQLIAETISHGASTRGFARTMRQRGRYCCSHE